MQGGVDSGNGFFRNYPNSSGRRRSGDAPPAAAELNDSGEKTVKLTDNSQKKDINGLKKFLDVIYYGARRRMRTVIRRRFGGAAEIQADVAEWQTR